MKGLFKIILGGESVEDKKIVDLYWCRDEKALTETAKKYGKYCFTIAFNILTNSEDAEESVNDSYLNAWNSMPPHRPEMLSTFLGKITRFISLKRWRQRNTQRRGSGEIAIAYEELSECIPSKTNIYETLETREIAKIVDLFLDELHITEQKVFVCRYWYFDSVSRIASRFQMTENNVSVTLNRIRVQLREYLLEGGFDL